MIHDISPKIFNNHYTGKSPEKASYIIFIREKSVLLKKQNGEISYPVFEEISEKIKTIYLFSIDNEDFFLSETDCADFFLARGYEFSDMADFRRLSPKWLSFAGITAFQLGCWYKNNRFCGRCGQELSHDVNERMLRCESCGNMVYPKISPAVIVGVTSGDKLLLTKYKGREHLPRYALIAGFVEIGESIEETVRREVMEEVGIRVKNIRYYKSQPWSFTDTLLMGFYCEADGEEALTVDRSELALAEWISRENMTTEDDGISLTYEMITKFKEEPSYFSE